jgi:hypothetical protein
MIELAPGKWPVAELEKQTDHLMVALAQLLPPAYWGIYAQRLRMSEAGQYGAGIVNEENEEKK